MQRAVDVRFVIKLRMLNRRTNARACGQMRDGFKLFGMKQIPHRGAVPKVDMVNSHVFCDGGNVCALDLRIVKIVEVIEDGDFVPGGEEVFGKVRANEAS